MERWSTFCQALRLWNPRCNGLGMALEWLPFVSDYFIKDTARGFRVIEISAYHWTESRLLKFRVLFLLTWSVFFWFNYELFNILLVCSYCKKKHLEHAKIIVNMRFHNVLIKHQLIDNKNIATSKISLCCLLVSTNLFIRLCTLLVSPAETYTSTFDTICSVVQVMWQDGLYTNQTRNLKGCVTAPLEIH